MIWLFLACADPLSVPQPAEPRPAVDPLPAAHPLPAADAPAVACKSWRLSGLSGEQNWTMTPDSGDGWVMSHQGKITSSVKNTTGKGRLRLHSGEGFQVTWTGRGPHCSIMVAPHEQIRGTLSGAVLPTTYRKKSLGEQEQELDTMEKLLDLAYVGEPQ